MTEKREIFDMRKKHVAQILKQLTDDYQQTRDERTALAKAIDTETDDFTLLEEIELLTVSIRGFGSQFVSQNGIANSQVAIAQLKQLKVFDIPAIAQFCFNDSIKSDQLKLYISLLDYLRLLVLDYLIASLTTEPVAA